MIKKIQMDLALGTIEKNLQNHFPTKNLSRYKQQVALLAAAINHNRDLLQKKKDNPGEVIILDPRRLTMEKANEDGQKKQIN